MNSATRITAHTGADQTPDNSLEFVRHVLATSADALEVDVRRDGRTGALILSHNPDAENPPTLAETFAQVAVHPAMCINCDLKEPGLEGPVGDLAAACGLTGRLIFSGTVGLDALEHQSELPGRPHLYLNLEEWVDDLYFRYRECPNFELEAAKEILTACRRYGVDVVNVNFALLTRRFLETLAAEGVGVSAWTVNEPEDLAYFRARGVYNLTTRNLQAALAL